MQLTTVLAVAASLTAAVAMPAVPDTASTSARNCNSDDHPCQTYETYPKCSHMYNALLEMCEYSHCRFWFVDPSAECNNCSAENTMHVCNRMSNRDQVDVCTSEWFKLVNACKATGCRKWVQDPIKICTQRGGSIPRGSE